MAKKNSTKKEETTVDTTTQVVDTTPNTNEEVATMTTETTTEAVVESKSSKAQVIYTEEAAKGDDKLRARVIARFKSELGMSPQGASTYFQNCKTKANGGKVKHYRPKSDKKVVDKTDDSKEDTILFDVEMEDGTIHSFTTQEAAEQHIAEKGGELVVEATQEAA